MSKLLPAGKGGGHGSAKGSGGGAASVVSGGAMCSTEAAQQAHVHRTQNPGQPLSGADSRADRTVLGYDEGAEAARVRYENREDGDEQRPTHPSDYNGWCCSSGFPAASDRNIETQLFSRVLSGGIRTAVTGRR